MGVVNEPWPRILLVSAYVSGPGMDELFALLQIHMYMTLFLVFFLILQGKHLW